MSPNKFSVRLLPLAEFDLEEIIGFIASDNLLAADTLLNRLESSLATLEVHPFAGKIPADPELANIGYRYLIIDNYLAFYTIKRSVVTVHRIIHGARNYLELLD